MKNLTNALMFLAVMIFGTISVQADEVVLIVNSENPLTDISLKDVKKIYLGKSKFFPGGGKVIPADQAANSDVRAMFYEVIVGRSKSQLKKYWSKRIFTGKGTPPTVKKDDAAMLTWVAEQPQALGYMFRHSVDESVKILNLK